MANLMQDKKKQIIALAVLGVFLLILPFAAGALGQAWVRILNVTLLYVMPVSYTHLDVYKRQELQ